MGVSFLAFSPNSNVASYAYFCLGSNGTFVIETRLLSTDKLNGITDDESIYGYTRWAENWILKSDRNWILKSDKIGISSEAHPISKCDSNAVSFSDDTDTEILIMTIESWEERRQNNQPESNKVMGALLLDNDEYRPSSPLKKVTKIKHYNE